MPSGLRLPPRRTGRNLPVTLASVTLADRFRPVADPVTALPTVAPIRPIGADRLFARGLITARQHEAAGLFRDVVEAADRVSIASPGLVPRVSGGGGHRDTVPEGRLLAQRRLADITSAIGVPAVALLRAIIVSNVTLGDLADRQRADDGTGRGKALKSVSAGLREALDGLADHLAHRHRSGVRQGADERG